VRAMLESYGDKFSQPQARPDDFRAVADHVLIIVCFHEGDQNAPKKEQRQSWIADLNEEGRVRRVIVYPSPADAVRAFEALSAAAPKVHA
jgi:hypothetical protein